MFNPADFEALKEQVDNRFADLIDRSHSWSHTDDLELRATELLDKIDAVRKLAREYEMLAPVGENAHDALVAALQAALPYIEDIVNTEGAKGASGPDEYGDGGWTHLENAERMNVIAEQVRSALALAAPKEAVK